MLPVPCIILEDNPTDAAYLQQLIAGHPSLSLKASFNNPLDAAGFMQQFRPPLVFMDIDMPLMDGMTLFKSLDPAPVCVFVTAHSEFALEGFETQAFDYILKPVRPARFAHTVQRLQEYFNLLRRSDLYDAGFDAETIRVKESTTTHMIPLKDILYIEALKDYSKVVTANQKIMTLSKLKHFLDKLPAGRFVRIHRSFAVALDKIQAIESNDVRIGGTILPVGKTFKQSLKTLL